MATSHRRLALVTGASTGIGLELARCCAADQFDLVIVADEPEVEAAGRELARMHGVDVDAYVIDLSTTAGVDDLKARLGSRPVDALLANAGRGLAEGFLDQNFDEVRRVIDTNVTGTLYLLHTFGRDMRARGTGRILITGSIAGFIPGAFHAVYNASKAFIDSFSHAIRRELKDSGVTVTLLMPGATETEFFDRAGLMDTKLGVAKKADPAGVAADGFKAMMAGDDEIVSGWANRMTTAAAAITPSSVLADQHAKQAKPGSARS